MCARSRRRPRQLGHGTRAALDEHRVDSRERERRDRARLEAGRARDLLGAGDPRALLPAARRDLLGVGAPVAGHEREHRAAVADEDERLDDLRELAAGRLRRVLRGRRALRELLDARLGAELAQERGDALDGLGPGTRLATSPAGSARTPRLEVTRRACGCRPR